MFCVNGGRRGTTPLPDSSHRRSRGRGWEWSGPMDQRRSFPGAVTRPRVTWCRGRSEGLGGQGVGPPEGETRDPPRVEHTSPVPTSTSRTGPRDPGIPSGPLVRLLPDGPQTCLGRSEVSFDTKATQDVTIYIVCPSPQRPMLGGRSRPFSYGRGNPGRRDGRLGGVARRLVSLPDLMWVQAHGTVDRGVTKSPVWVDHGRSPGRLHHPPETTSWASRVA